jgi:predicted secreted protein
MKLMRIAAVLALCLLLGCGEPLPADKSAYAGEWRSEKVWLLITKEGHVQYERQDGNKKISINAPIKAFDGNNFSVGVGMFSTTFVVSRPPHQVGNVWKMTVDGVELVRGVGPAERQA